MFANVIDNWQIPICPCDQYPKVINCFSVSKFHVNHLVHTAIIVENWRKHFKSMWTHTWNSNLKFLFEIAEILKSVPKQYICVGNSFKCNTCLRIPHRYLLTSPKRTIYSFEYFQWQIIWRFPYFPLRVVFSGLTQCSIWTSIRKVNNLM